MIKFFYGTMYSGKTLHLIQNHEILSKKKQQPVIIKKDTDTRDKHDKDGWGVIASRFNPNKTAGCYYFHDLKKELPRLTKNFNTILIDEAQFLTNDEVKLLTDFSYMSGINITAYGLKTDVNGNLFEGSSALLANADEIREIPSLCQEKDCMNNANYHARYIDGIRDTDTKSIKIEQGNVTYKALCYKHWRNM